MLPIIFKKARRHFWLYRGTWGVRMMLSLGFIPTGFVKLLGLPFTNLGQENAVGVFFDAMLSTGIYWQFLGAMQVLAGVLVLFQRTLALGAILFSGIMLNILFITLGVGFGNTTILVAAMLLACGWLCIWEWEKVRVLFYGLPKAANHEGGVKAAISVGLSPSEKLVYGIGFASTLVLMAMTRGLKLPLGTEFILAGIALICFIIALFLGFRVLRRNKAIGPLEPGLG